MTRVPVKKKRKRERARKGKDVGLAYMSVQCQPNVHRETMFMEKGAIAMRGVVANTHSRGPVDAHPRASLAMWKNNDMRTR